MNCITFFKVITTFQTSLASHIDPYPVLLSH